MTITHALSPDPDATTKLTPARSSLAHATTTLTFLVYIRALLNFNIGGASAAGVLAILLANIVAFFLMRAVARSINR